jgi:DNA-binding response OmpR family regulator
VRVLLCEDEPKMAALIKRVLTAERHVVDLVPDGVSALALGSSGDYDVAIIDRMLPDLDGLAVIRGLRAKGVKTPVLVLTALGSVDHRVAGLDAGADDYLPKPFAFAELLARVRALARREGTTAPTVLAAGDLTLDETRHVARVGELAVDLSAREFALLGYLIRHAGQVLTRQQILDAVWGAEPDVYSNVVDLYVHYLRRKLAGLGRADRLRTVRGVGYVLRAGGDPSSTARQVDA